MIKGNYVNMKSDYKMKFKGIFFLMVVAVAAASCLGGSTYNNSYTEIVTFEYGDSNFNSDSLFFDTEAKIGLGGWFCMAFYHKVDETTEEFKGGFLASRLSIPESGLLDGLSNNQYRVNTKVPKNAPGKFAVFSITDDMPEDHFRFIFDNSGEMKGTCTMQSVEVNNTVAVAQAAQAIMDDPDREAVLKLVATGYLAEKETGKAEIVLVDTQEDSTMSHWTEFKDLSKLNSVDAVRFSLISEGADFPLSVCLDNMKMNVTLVVE